MKLHIISLMILIMMGFTSFAETHAANTELESAQKLASMGVINDGSSATDFGLSQTITRKEMMKVTLNLSGKNVSDTCVGSFSDVESDWGCKYIEAGLEYEFIADNETFRPNDTISKAEAMKLMLGARGIEKAYNTSDWQADWMNTALDAGIITSSYSDHNTAALRGWIFGVAAAEGSDMMKEDEMMMKEDEMMMKEEHAGYKNYDESLIGVHETTVIFFHASWCPSCRTADGNFSSATVDNMLLLKADFDSSTDLRKKYEVISQHTFVQVDAQGEMIMKWTGSNDIESIEEKIN